MAKPLKLSPTVRSIFAIVDGLLLFLALEGVFYAIAFLGLNRSFDTPTIPYLTANLVWAVLAALLAGYTAARVAHRSPLAHGVITSIPFFLLGAFNLFKGIGDRRTPFVLAYNTLVPLAVIVGALLLRARKGQSNALRP
jgi:peptidoglycan/LPS O-acetylase OafA/YrhL